MPKDPPGLAETMFPPVNYDKPSLFSSRHRASFFGIVEILADLVELKGCDINKTDCIGTVNSW